MGDSDYSIQLDFFPLSKAQILPNGFVRFVAPIARATLPGEKGFLNIDRATGKPYYQRVTKELLESTAKNFVNLPITHLHFPGVRSTTPNVVRGLGGSSKDSVFQVDSYQFSTGTIFDEELIKLIKDKTAREISPGYKVKLSPLQGDTRDQLDRQGDHFSFVPKGRQGESVALQLDASDIPWDFAMAESQYDEAELKRIKDEIVGLPASFLDLSFSNSVIDLNTVKIQTDEQTSEQNKETKEKTSMNTFSIVTDKSQVVSFQADDANVVNYITELKASKDQLIIDKSTIQSQLDNATAEITSLKAQLAEKPAATETTQTDSAETNDRIQATAQKMALDFIKVVPNILKVKPDFQFDAVLSLPEMQKQFLILASPEKKAVFEALQTDESTEAGKIGAAKISAYYEVLSASLPAKTETKTQNDASAFSEAFKAILNNSTGVAPEMQQDAAERASDDARKERAARIAKNAETL